MCYTRSLSQQPDCHDNDKETVLYINIVYYLIKGTVLITSRDEANAMLSDEALEESCAEYGYEVEYGIK